MSEGRSSVWAPSPAATDICALSIVGRNMSKCFHVVMLSSGLTEIRTQSSGLLRGAQITGAEVSTVTPNYFGVLGAELVARHALGAYNFGATLRLLEELCTPKHTHISDGGHM